MWLAIIHLNDSPDAQDGNEILHIRTTPTVISVLSAGATAIA